MKVRHPILLVDDEPEILFSLRGLLRHDFEVHTAQGGAEALAILRVLGALGWPDLRTPANEAANLERSSSRNPSCGGRIGGTGAPGAGFWIRVWTDSF